MLRIVTDGAADMPETWANTYEIHMLPLNVQFGGETYTQGPGFTNSDFYRMVREKKIIPKTSLPSIGQVKAFYRSIAQHGDTILSIHISSKLSGTVATVEAAAGELSEEFKIIVFDSLAGSMAQAFMAREARLMERAGAALPEILHRLEVVRQQIVVFFTLDTLEYAYLSGRISALQNLVVAALKVKPIITLRDGLLEMSEKVRTRHRSLQQVAEKLFARMEGCRINLAVVHAADPQTASALYAKIGERMEIGEGVITELAIPVAANLGPGAIGIVAYPAPAEGETDRDTRP
jgi:DegV family protein with EDD domain